MDARDQLMVNLKQDNQLLRKENEILRMELLKFSGINFTALNLKVNENHSNNFNTSNNNNQLYLPPINLSRANSHANIKSFNNNVQNRSPSPKKKNILDSLTSLKEKNELKHKNSINPINQINSINQINPINQMNPMNPINQNFNENFFNNSKHGVNNSIYDKQYTQVIDENIKLKEKIANLEIAFLSGSQSQQSRSQFSKFDNNNEMEENVNTPVRSLIFFELKIVYLL